MLFEDFLDNIATENEFLFHTKVPASLSWDGFMTTKNRAFDDVKHSGLHFGSDAHFSSTNGYIATHKYVPAGYGHVHPQSMAQRNRRSSSSSRVASRRPSPYETGATTTTGQTQPHIQDSGLPGGQSLYVYPQATRDANSDLPEASASASSSFMHNAIESHPYTAQDRQTSDTSKLHRDIIYRSNETTSTFHTIVDSGVQQTESGSSARTHRPPIRSTSPSERETPWGDDGEKSRKKIKIEDNLGKQTLTAGECNS